MANSHHTVSVRFARWVALICVILVTGGGRVVAAEEDTRVRLMIGRSAVVNTDWPIARVSVTSSDIADAVVTLPNQVLIQGKAPGTISMFLWDRGGTMRRYDVVVERDLTRLVEQVGELFPGEPIKVESNGKSIVLSGNVSSKFAAEKAIEVAAGYVEKKEDVVSLLQVQAGAPAQVLLKVRFAEVSRNALTELGASFFTGLGGYKDYVARGTTQQFPAPDFDADKGLVFSDFLNLFVFDLKNQLGLAIKALQSKGMFQSLAEPNLVAETGKEASFLAGGEFPIPVAQAGSGNLAISVVFKEFGIRLNFTPTVVPGGRVRLKVRPEVSSLDFSNAVVLQGFRIPALSTRRTETELELQDGQTFAIAGLLNNTTTQTLQKIPGIGDIPILGLLFRSKAAQKSQTELVVMITPHILTPTSPGVTDQLPRQVEPYMPPVPVNKSFPPPPPAFSSPRGSSGGTGAAGAAAPTAPAPPVTSVPTPDEAARVLGAGQPRGPQFVKPAAPESEPKPAATPAARTETRPLTAREKQEMEKSLEDQRKADERLKRAMREQAERQAKEDEIEKKRLAREQKLLQERNREQAKRDAEAAAKAAKEAARQAEIDKKQQKVIEEAAAKLKAAEAAYQAEVAKKNQQQHQQ